MSQKTISLNNVRLRPSEEDGTLMLKLGMIGSQSHLMPRKRKLGTQHVMYAWPHPHRPSRPFPARKVG